MKKRFLLLIVICTMLQVITNGTAKGQTTLHINGAMDSLGGSYCHLPVIDQFYISASITGYLSTDSITVHIYFGDGNDTIYKELNYDSTYQVFFTQTDWHNYTSAGQYSVKYVLTGPDGLSDSVIHYNQLTISDTCGNISGRVYVDNNSNCIFDGGDSVLRYYPVEVLLGANIVAWGFTDTNGNYSISVPIGYTYTVQPESPINYGFQVNCPSIGNYNINLTSSSSGNDFGVNCLNGFDMAGAAGGWYFRPGYDAYMDVWAANLRCQSTSGTVKLILDPLVSYVNTISGIPPTTISGDTLIWDYTNLTNNYYYFWYWYWWNTNDLRCYMTLHTSPNAVLGDSVCFDLIVDPIIGDIDPTNNTEHFCRVISNSWDPNYKQVNPVGQGPNGSIAPNQKLTYTIHYQNVGNDTAYNVAIYDTLDGNLDVNTLQVINSDHNYALEMLPGNVLKFIFNNIMLPDSTINPITS